MSINTCNLIYIKFLPIQKQSVIKGAARKIDPTNSQTNLRRKRENKDSHNCGLTIFHSGEECADQGFLGGLQQRHDRLVQGVLVLVQPTVGVVRHLWIQTY